ncbi:MarR family winged helix-turn-helix transcriptional regulator [Bifidobacterium favimelis]|uniref:MarR family transcriptional regulator n=2 Tax=Bifidobacterium favimelis TaxID=3122979 RepID=A0ABU8ZMC1_9BIFI
MQKGRRHMQGMTRMEENPGSLIKKANILIEKHLTSQVKVIFPDLTGTQFIIVYFLYEAEGTRVTQKDVADRFCLSHPTVRSIVKRLEASGWVAAHPLPEDRRQVRLSITDMGRRRMSVDGRRIADAMNGTNSLALKGFSPEEKSLLVSFLNRIIHTMRHADRAGTDT